MTYGKSPTDWKRLRAQTAVVLIGLSVTIWLVLILTFLALGISTLVLWVLWIVATLGAAILVFPLDARMADLRGKK
jgi:hypothetical protein